MCLSCPHFCPHPLPVRLLQLLCDVPLAYLALPHHVHPLLPAQWTVIVRVWYRRCPPLVGQRVCRIVPPVVFMVRVTPAPCCSTCALWCRLLAPLACCLLVPLRFLFLGRLWYTRFPLSWLHMGVHPPHPCSGPCLLPHCPYGVYPAPYRPRRLLRPPPSVPPFVPRPPLYHRIVVNVYVGICGLVHACQRVQQRPRLCLVVVLLPC